MRLFTPADVTALTGTPSDRLRDWRRRGFMKDCGGYALPGGAGWTNDPNHPKLTASKLVWSYSLGDILRIAIADELTKLKIDLSLCFEIATHAALFVLKWSNPPNDDSQNDWREFRFMVAYPAGTGEDTIPGSPVQAIRLQDLNRITAFAGPASIVLDFERLSQALPSQLRAELRM